MTRNSKTVRRRRKHGDWFYWDQLPVELRTAMADAAFRWDSKWLLDLWNKGRHSIPDLVRLIHNADRTEAAKDIVWRDGNRWRKAKSPLKATGVSILYSIKTPRKRMRAA